MNDSWGERKAAGRLLRKVAPRSAHGEGISPDGGRDPLEVLNTQAASRVPELVPIRHSRMAESPFAFFRGGAAIMAMDLATTVTTGVMVQACGDAHVSNFGKFATPERNLVFDINDFDETLPGPWEWDVKRLCASLQIVAHERGSSPRTCRRVVRTAAREYRERMASYATKRALELWYDRIAMRDLFEHFPRDYQARLRRDVKRAQRKDHLRAVARHTRAVDGHLRFVDDPPLITHISDTNYDLDDAMSFIESYRGSLTDERRHLFDRFRTVDVARKVVGVGSVGTRCWIGLLEGPSHRLGDRIVLQVKQAQPSVLEPYVGASTSGHHGRRVVIGQRLTQAASDIFLGWGEGARSGHEYYVRQLWDVKGQGDPMAMNANNLGYYGALCAWALARAHARTGDAVQISGYLGSSDVFDRAVADFAEHYAIVNEHDHALFVDAIKDGSVEASVEL
jgi:uncharacterized protein (DUF2252 family)